MSSAAASPEKFPLARLTVIPAKSKRGPRRYVRLAMSQRLYWKVVNPDKDPAPTSLYDFVGQCSLSLKRLSSTATWEDVENKIAPHGDDGIIIPGRLYGRAQKNKLSKLIVSDEDEDSVVLTARTTDERNQWMHEMRLRISPPKVLQERAKNDVGDEPGTASGSLLINEMNSLFIGVTAEQYVDELKEKPSEWVDQVSSAVSCTTDGADRIDSAVPKVDWIDKINTQLKTWIDFIASAVKKGAGSCEIVAGTAQDVADYAKFIPGGISSVFQLVALSARLVVMFAEAGRGCRELPGILAKVMELLDCVAGSVVPILNPATTLVETKEILEGNVFDVLVATFDLAWKIEEQLMRSSWSRVINSSVVKEIEGELTPLKQMVVSVALTEQMKNIEQQVAIVYEKVEKGFDEVSKKFDDLALRPTEFLSTESYRRPEPSPFFVGRRDELLLLRKALQERGSAAITGLGGVGKTQLMATVVKQIELSGDVPGGVFWLTADGKAEEIIESLATFAEKIHGQKMRNEDRANLKAVVDAIGNGLNKGEGRWLLCVDNVDYAGLPEVNAILGALTSMAKGRGWVIFTSRAGNSKLWMRMKPSQNVVLNPLSTEDAMLVMLRLRESIDTDEANDEAVREQLGQLETENRVDFEALRELAEYLCGLPLALIQAGAYVGYQDCSFSEYLQLYRSASKKSDFDVILRRTEDDHVPVREEQRGIFTTWKMSVEKLSEEAVPMLHAAAMFGSARIPGDLLKEVLNEMGGGNEAPEIRYARVVPGELVCSSSLLQKHRGEGEDWFNIHRLVRLFVLVSMEEDDPQEWDTELRRVIKATHSYVGDVLDEAGKNFYDDLDGHGDRQLELLPHTRSIMRHREKRGCIALEKECVDLYHFNGTCLEWNARFSEAEEVYDAVLDMEKAIYGVDASNMYIAVSLQRKGIVYQKQGKLGQAEAIFEKSLVMDLHIHGSERPHPDVANSYHNLGVVYQEQGKLQQAEAMYDKSLEMRLAIYGTETAHPGVASSYHQLGWVYQEQGKLQQAESMYDKSLKMLLVIHGSVGPHPNVAMSYHNLGMVYQRQGKLQQAEEMYDKSLKMMLAIHGTERPHPRVASSYLNLGTVYQEQGKLKQAEAMYDKCLKMYLAIHGTERPHPDVALSCHNLGIVYQDQDKLQEAEEMYDQSLEMRLAIHGTERPNPQVASSYGQLGNLYNDQGKPKEAEEMFRKCLEMEMAIYGADRPHPSVAGTLNNLGNVLSSQGHRGEALGVYLRALEMYRGVFGEDSEHPSIVAVVNNIRRLQNEEGATNPVGRWMATAVLWCTLAAVHLMALVSGTHAALLARCATGTVEPWRAVMAAAVHRGVPHLAANLVVLVPLGFATEIVYGAPAFLSLTLCGTAAGAILSALVGTARVSQVCSVGPSGALHALAGALLAHVVLNRMALGMKQWLVVAALVASCAAAVDIWVNVGGLLGGFVVGALLSPRFQRRGNVFLLVRRASRRRAFVVGIIVCAALYATLLVGVSWQNIFLLGGL